MPLCFFFPISCKTKRPIPQRCPWLHIICENNSTVASFMGPAQRALGNKAVCISGSLQHWGVYPYGPSSSSHRQVLSACVYSLLMYHKFADTVTLESARAGNQRAALTTGEGTDSPRFPQCSLHMEGATRELAHASWGLPAHCRYCM